MSLIIISIPVYFLLITIEVMIARVQKRKMYRLGDAFANIGCGIFEQVTGLFAKVFTIGLFVFVYEHFRVFTIPTNVLTVFTLWLAVDFLYYWAHRWSHEINLFWVGHVVHHQSEDYNLSVALRQGALQKFFTSPVYLPLALLGFSPEWFLTISAINTLYQFWIHTELIGKMGWFEYVFNTPSHHRVHHGKDPKYIDRNHGGSLIIWDRMFGTFQPEIEKPHYGITRATFTFNPIKAHWKAIVDLAGDFRKVKGKDKLKVLFKGPGWFPDYLGGPTKPDVIDDSSYSRFGFSNSARLNLYLFIQFILILGVTAYFLFQSGSMTTALSILFALSISIFLFSLGYLIEGGLYSFFFESVKWIFLLIPFYVAEPGGIWMYVFVPFALGSIYIYYF